MAIPFAIAGMYNLSHAVIGLRSTCFNLFVNASILKSLQKYFSPTNLPINNSCNHSSDFKISIKFLSSFTHPHLATIIFVPSALLYVSKHSIESLHAFVMPVISKLEVHQVSASEINGTSPLIFHLSPADRKTLVVRRRPSDS